MQLKYPLFVGEIEGDICRLLVFWGWGEFAMFLEEFRNDMNSFHFWDADLNPLVLDPMQSELSENMFRAFIQGIDYYSVPAVDAYSLAKKSGSWFHNLRQVKAFVQQYMQSNE